MWVIVGACEICWYAQVVFQKAYAALLRGISLEHLVNRDHFLAPPPLITSAQPVFLGLHCAFPWRVVSRCSCLAGAALSPAPVLRFLGRHPNFWVGEEEIVSCSEVLAHFNLSTQGNVLNIHKYCIFVCLWPCLAGPSLLFLI